MDSARAHAASLAGLPGMSPVRLARLLGGLPPEQAWEALRAGTHPGDPRRRFIASARGTDVEEVGERYAHARVSVLVPHTPGYPTVLAADPGGPAVLFALGDPSVVEHRPRVAMVGTASPTRYGLQVASEMAAELADGGVAVVSGLSVGIDAAAHAGVVRRSGPSAAPPVAVAGTGLDRPHPHQNRELWNLVAATGVVFSEAVLGAPPGPAGFRARSRIVAALSDVVVVVESHRNGESDSTVEAATRRSVPVCAVPGSVRSRASHGTNQLLVDGCAPVRDATDVLVAVYLARVGRGDAMVPIPAAGSRDRMSDTGSQSASRCADAVALGDSAVGCEAGPVGVPSEAGHFS